ncbi:MAG TPA: VWA domain-containing protein [Methylomirabilota bacterium]|jgi:hypothetical protein
MLEALLEFIRRLRARHVPVSLVETLDAMDALRRVDLLRRHEVYAALRATLVKRAEHLEAFDALFDVWFATAPRAPAPAPSSSPTAPSAASAGVADPELVQALLDALGRDDAEALHALAATAVRRFAGIEAEGTASARYHLSRVLRQLALSELLRRTLQDEREETGGGLGERLRRDEAARRVEELRRMIAAAVRDRLVDVKGRSAAAAMYREPLVEDADVLRASAAQLREMRRAIQPLARKLAARIARRRRLRRAGRLDVRRTLRRSLSAGGVPLEPAFRRRKVSRPEVYLLCDLSGSVAEFARFTMSLLYALTEELGRVRSFAFVDDVDEVTPLVAAGGAPLTGAHVLARSRAVRGQGHSDYGHVLDAFWVRYGESGLGPRSTVIICGDARTNYRDPGVRTLRAIAARARRVYWLNPEPRAEWNTTDSVIGLYAPYCTGVFEARTLRQLAAFVQQIA